MFFEKGCAGAVEVTVKSGIGEVEVYFDDFNVEHTKSPVIQAQEYYPFGLTFGDYQRDNSLKNRYLYNKGAERLDELDLNIDATKYRVYDAAIDRWWQVDPLADEGGLVSLTPYNYSFNNPIRYNDPDGDCPLCIPIAIAVAEGVTVVAEGATIAAGLTTIAIGLKAYGKQILEAMGNATPYSTPGVDAAQSLGGVKSLNSTTNSGESKTSQPEKKEKDPTANRVKPRKETLEKVKENQPKNENGEMIDPNTKKALDPKKTDLGHKPGEEWKKRKEMHKEKGSTRKEVIEAENDPNLYQYEDRSSNRSHAYEKKN